MKKTVIFLLFSVISLSITSHILGKFNLGFNLPITKVVTNNSIEFVGLYPEDSTQDKIVAYLKPGKSLPFAYSGKSGDWKYVWLNGQVLSARSNHIRLKYQLYRRWEVSQNWLNNIYELSLLGGVISFLLIIVQISLSRRTQKRSVDIDMAHRYQNEANYHKQQSALKDTQNAQLREMLETQNRQYHANEKKQLEKAKLEKARFRRELEKTAKIESEARFQTTISEMQSSYDRLFKKYQRVKSEAVEFGIDFDDPIYEKLLKGRRYELCVATSLVNKGKFRILEWTPDKGFESNINVASNTNPDLIIEDMNSGIVAIECKYRSKFYYRDRGKRKEISWTNLKQVRRYQKYSKLKGVPVWIALGFDGDTSSPDSRSPKHHYLIPLDQIYSDSRKEDPDGKGTQLIVLRSKIYKQYVKSGDYSRYLESKLSVDS